MVAINSTVGKALKSSGRSMNSTTKRISTDKVIDSARQKSSSHAGIGRMSTTRMPRMPSASAMSPRRNAAMKRLSSSASTEPRPGCPWSVAGGFVDSAMAWNYPVALVRRPRSKSPAGGGT